MGHMKDFDRRIRQGGDDAIAAVSELLPRWIPVGERLPEEEMVLVWSSSNGLHLARLDSRRQWLDADDNPGKKITHWMPLPEPPST